MTDLNVTAEKLIDVLRRQLNEANYQLAMATAAAETAAERAAEAENRVTELESQTAAERPNPERAP